MINKTENHSEVLKHFMKTTMECLKKESSLDQWTFILECLFCLLKSLTESQDYLSLQVGRPMNIDWISENGKTSDRTWTIRLRKEEGR